MTHDPTRTTLSLAAGVVARRTDDGLLRLIVPQQPRSWRRIFAARQRPVELDAVGTWVVERLEGRTLAHLADDLAAHLRLTRREAETALADFARLLITRHLARVEIAA